MDKLDPDKKPGDYSEEEIKQMFIDMFFWVAENRMSWLAECIQKRKAQLIQAGVSKHTLKKVGGAS
jgi:hypothetical protein